ncbi:hypothetical protein PN471_07375 [Aphanizomenon sp. CS-733/32]|nr:hypothetical protein [Aphanizomenon sp. CS-733/32]MDB9308459.1 hypothetical protein [Aphanizomenon sp. CS-733/32]
MTLTINNLEKIEQILKDDDNDYQILPKFWQLVPPFEAESPEAKIEEK